MSHLLDTHVVLYWWANDKRLSKKTRALIASAAELYVSAVSIFEIATKHRIGKLPQVAEIAEDLVTAVRDQGFVLLNLTSEEAQLAGAFAQLHRDPFDRLLAAQAQRRKLTLVTNDPMFAPFAIKTFW